MQHSSSSSPTKELFPSSPSSKMQQHDSDEKKSALLLRNHSHASVGANGSRVVATNAASPTHSSHTSLCDAPSSDSSAVVAEVNQHLSDEVIRLKKKCNKLQEMIKQQAEGSATPTTITSSGWGSLLLGKSSTPTVAASPITPSTSSSSLIDSTSATTSDALLKSRLLEKVLRDELLTKVQENESLHEKLWNETQDRREREDLLSQRLSEMKETVQKLEVNLDQAVERKEKTDEEMLQLRAEMQKKIHDISSSYNQLLCDTSTSSSQHTQREQQYSTLLKQIRSVMIQQGMIVDDRVRLREWCEWKNVDASDPLQSAASSSTPTSSSFQFSHHLFTCIYSYLDETHMTFSRIKVQLLSLIRYAKEMVQVDLKERIEKLEEKRRKKITHSNSNTANLRLPTSILSPSSSAPPSPFISPSTTSTPLIFPPDTYPVETQLQRQQLTECDLLLKYTEELFGAFLRELKRVRTEVGRIVKWKLGGSGDSTSTTFSSTPSTPSTSLPLNILIDTFLQVLRTSVRTLTFLIGYEESRLTHQPDADANSSKVDPLTREYRTNLLVQYREMKLLLNQAMKSVKYMTVRTGQIGYSSSSKRSSSISDASSTNTSQLNSIPPSLLNTPMSSRYASLVSTPSIHNSAFNHSIATNQSFASSSAASSSSSPSIHLHPAYHRSLALPSTWPIVFLFEAVLLQQQQQQQQSSTSASNLVNNNIDPSWPSSPLPFMDELQNAFVQLTKQFAVMVAHETRDDHSSSSLSSSSTTPPSPTFSSFILSNILSLHKLITFLPMSLSKYVESIEEERKEGWEGEKGMKRIVAVPASTMMNKSGEVEEKQQHIKNFLQLVPSPSTSHTDVTSSSSATTTTQQSASTSSASVGGITSMTNLRAHSVRYLSTLHALSTPNATAPTAVPYRLALSQQALLRTNEAEYTRMTREFGVLERDTKQANYEREKAVEQLAEAEGREREVRKQLAEKDYQINTLQSEYATTKALLFSTETELSQSKSSAEQDRNDAASLLTTIREAHALELSTLQAQLTTLQYSFTSSTQREVQLQSDLTSSQTTVTSLQQELLAHSHTIQEYERKIVSQSTRYKTVTEELKKAKAEMSGVQEEMRKLRQEWEEEKKGWMTKSVMNGNVNIDENGDNDNSQQSQSLVSLSIEPSENDEQLVLLSITASTLIAEVSAISESISTSSSSVPSFYETTSIPATPVSSLPVDFLSSSASPGVIATPLPHSSDSLLSFRSFQEQLRETVSRCEVAVQVDVDELTASDSVQTTAAVQPLFVSSETETTPVAGEEDAIPVASYDLTSSAANAAVDARSSHLPPTTLPLYHLGARAADEIDPHDLYDEEEENNQEEESSDDGPLTSSSPPSPNGANAHRQINRSTNEGLGVYPASSHSLAKAANAIMPSQPRIPVSSTWHNHTLQTRLTTQSTLIHASHTSLAASDARASQYFLQLQQVASLLQTMRTANHTANAKSVKLSTHVTKLQEELKATKENYEQMNIELTEKVCQLTEQLATQDAKKQSGLFGRF